jgi:hypothetical protein
MSFARIVQRHGGNSGVRMLSCGEQFRPMASHNSPGAKACDIETEVARATVGGLGNHKLKLKQCG